MTSRSVNEGNLGAGGRRKRLIFGLIALTGAVGLIVVGRVNGLMAWIVLFPLMLAGFLGLFQAKEKT